MRIVLLNTSILTNFGTFKFRPIELNEVREIVQYTPENGYVDNEILSAIGHASTADILSELLEINVPVNRIQYKQEISDLAIVFKLNGRPEEGKILNREEIENIGYSFGILQMTKEYDPMEGFLETGELDRTDWNC